MTSVVKWGIDLICKTCLNEKSEVDFYRRSDNGKFRTSCKGCWSATVRIWQEKNQSKVRSAYNRYDAKRTQSKERQEYVRAYATNYRGINRDSILLSAKQTYSRRREQMKETDITVDWLVQQKHSTSLCPNCDIELTTLGINEPTSKHLDHIIPLNIGGLHLKSNVRYICRTCNLTRPRDGRDIGA